VYPGEFDDKSEEQAYSEFYDKLVESGILRIHEEPYEEHKRYEIIRDLQFRVIDGLWISEYNLSVFGQRIDISLSRIIPDNNDYDLKSIKCGINRYGEYLLLLLSYEYWEEKDEGIRQRVMSACRSVTLRTAAMLESYTPRPQSTGKPRPMYCACPGGEILPGDCLYPCAMVPYVQ
jgi:hypothetical protein